MDMDLRANAMAYMEVVERETSGEPTVVVSDSQVALTMARNPANKLSRLQFVRDAVDYLLPADASTLRRNRISAS